MRDIRTSRLVLSLALLCGTGWKAAAADLEPLRTDRVRHMAPPPAAPVQERSGALSQASRTLLSVPPGLTLYSIGDPTDEEQLYLEYMNRARLDPASEGRWLQALTDPDVTREYSHFAVDLALMASQFAALSNVPPLSMNAQLTAAARLHSQDMFTNRFQGHIGTDGSDFGVRTTAQGYRWSTVGENVFSYADSVLHGHAAFQVDWGGDATTGGMQSPPGHRLNNHSASFREVGIGVVNGTNGDVGPQLVTQDFGSRQDITPFVTGVAYYDLNGNRFYDVGEGLGGVTILVDGSPFYAITATSGGYSVPVLRDGDYAVTFSVPGMNAQLTNAVVRGSNVKIDHILAYAPPQLSGPEAPAVGSSNPYTFEPVGGAVAYQWRQARLAPVTVLEGAENGLGSFTASVSESYPVIDNAVHSSGSGSLHLAHPVPEDQVLTLERTFRAGPETALSFATRVSWASSHQVARAQITVDDGQSWEDIWNQAGTGDAGDTAFTTQNIALGHRAGADFKLRFVYDIAGSTFFPQTESGVGFYIDDIVIANAFELLDQTVSEVTSTSLTFVPSEPGLYALNVRAQLPGRLLPWSPTKLVQAQAGPAPGANVQITSVKPLGDGRLEFDFSVANPGSGAYQVQAAPDPAGPWTEESAASVQSLGGSLTFRVATPAHSAAQRFYRIVAQ